MLFYEFPEQFERVHELGRFLIDSWVMACSRPRIRGASARRAVYGRMACNCVACSAPDM
jgi:hypothetical protein